MAPDPKLVQEALKKLREGKKPSYLEQRALDAWKRAEDEKSRLQHYATIPKKHWCSLAGCSNATANKQAAQFGVPIGGPTIDLRAVATWIRDHLRKHGARIQADESDPMLGGGPASPWLEAYRRERALAARYERRKREGELLERAEVHSMLAESAAVLRSAIETVITRHGQDAAEPVLEAVRQLAANAARFDGVAGGDDGAVGGGAGSAVADEPGPGDSRDADPAGAGDAGQNPRRAPRNKRGRRSQ